ncbi:MAG: hypothetical protein U9O78_02285 [Patescibacteria group bacterium]|nr:hypothetical protein [Patescibacteria group bacterium]
MVLSKEKQIATFDFWSEKSFQRSGENGIVKQICLSQGEYTLQASFPTGTWNNNVLLKDEVAIEVISGYSCDTSLSDNQVELDQLKYERWKQLYNDRGFLKDLAEGYMLTYPSYEKSTSMSDDVYYYEQNLVSNCKELFDQKNSAVIGIKLTEKNSLDSNSHQEFSQCLRDYAQNDQSEYFILINSLPDLVFSTNQIYMYYHYYLLLHQQPQTKVGVVVDKFDRFFYGFSDFFIFQPTDIPYSLSIEDLEEWLSKYDNLIDRDAPVFYKNEMMKI